MTHTQYLHSHHWFDLEYGFGVQSSGSYWKRVNSDEQFHSSLPEVCFAFSHFWITAQFEFQQVMGRPNIPSWRMNWTVQIDSF